MQAIAKLFTRSMPNEGGEATFDPLPDVREGIAIDRAAGI